MTWLIRGFWWEPTWLPPLAVILPNSKRMAYLDLARAKRAARNRRVYQKKKHKALIAVNRPDSLGP
jgi:hypothetical protein